MFSVEISDKILGRRSELIGRFGKIHDAGQQHPFDFFRPFDPERKQVGAFPRPDVRSAVVPEFAEVFPVQAVGRSVEPDGFAGGQHHDPLSGRFVPDDMRIAEVGDAGIRQNRIGGVFGPRASPVGAVCQSLRLGFDPSLGGGDRIVIGEDRQNRRIGGGSESGRVVQVGYAASRKDIAQAVRSQRDRHVLPVQQIAADGMSPVHLSPREVAVFVERDVLVAEVVLAVIINQSVRVAHPAFGRREVDSRTVIFGRLRLAALRCERRDAAGEQQGGDFSFHRVVGFIQIYTKISRKGNLSGMNIETDDSPKRESSWIYFSSFLTVSDSSSSCAFEMFEGESIITSRPELFFGKAM